jgi:hypothetical protein
VPAKTAVKPRTRKQPAKAAPTALDLVLPPDRREGLDPGAIEWLRQILEGDQTESARKEPA